MDDDDQRRQARVPPQGAGMRLDRFLVEHFPRYSRRAIARVIKRGEVLVNGRPGRPGQPLSAGDHLDLPVLSEAVQALKAGTRARGRLREQARAPEAVTVVHRDEHLLVVAKPPGLPVHGGAGIGASETLVERLREDVLAGYGLVHRLDRDTSGLVVLVRGEEARARLAAAFAGDEGEVEKVYEAIVEGVPEATTGSIDAPLAPPGHRGRARVDLEAGRAALTRYRVLEALDEAARLEVELATGRTHQIRVHLASIGHPLLVDARYGHRGGWRLVDPRGRLDARLRRTPLHATRLRLRHPVTGEVLEVESPLPGDMRYALEVLRVVAGRRQA